MPVRSNTYYGEPGLSYLIDPALSNVTILQVARSGSVHSLTGEEVIPSLHFVYGAATGLIHFSEDNPFNVPAGLGAEKIQVKYKT